LPGDNLGFENHLNYFHCRGHGLDLPLARGLATYLNSTLLDTYFRQFSGHTQVNATDLRNIKYPTLEQLRALGNQVDRIQPSQDEIDTLIRQELFGMADDTGDDPVQTKGRIDRKR
jgi:adenine-specific DNA-methyltransferase